MEKDQNSLRTENAVGSRLSHEY